MGEQGGGEQVAGWRPAAAASYWPPPCLGVANSAHLGRGRIVTKSRQRQRLLTRYRRFLESAVVSALHESQNNRQNGGVVTQPGAKSWLHGVQAQACQSWPSLAGLARLTYNGQFATLDIRGSQRVKPRQVEVRKREQELRRTGETRSWVPSWPALAALRSRIAASPLRHARLASSLGALRLLYRHSRPHAHSHAHPHARLLVRV